MDRSFVDPKKRRMWFGPGLALHVARLPIEEGESEADHCGR
jgi:hypothetical protein